MIFTQLLTSQIFFALLYLSYFLKLLFLPVIPTLDTNVHGTKMHSLPPCFINIALCTYRRKRNWQVLVWQEKKILCSSVCKHSGVVISWLSLWHFVCDAMGHQCANWCPVASVRTLMRLFCRELCSCEIALSNLAFVGFWRSHVIWDYFSFRQLLSRLFRTNCTGIDVNFHQIICYCLDS